MTSLVIPPQGTVPDHQRRWDLGDARPEHLFSLNGKVAVVTGAGGGVGGWLSVGLAAAGARLVLSDISEDRCADLSDFLKAAGVDHTIVATDLRDPGAPERIIGRTMTEFGGLDVLVNSAAVNDRRSISQVDLESWDEISSVNLRAAYFLAREAMPVMKDRGGGSIINITSINSDVGLEDISVYGAHKAALAQVTKTMCVEWARHNIRVNCISPGFLLTALSRPLWENHARAHWILDRCPLRRPGTPAELIGACLLLASPAGSFITGASIRVDGGLLSGSPWPSPST